MMLPQQLEITINNRFVDAKTIIKSLNLEGLLRYDDPLINFFMHFSRREHIPMQEAGRNFVEEKNVTKALENLDNLQNGEVFESPIIVSLKDVIGYDTQKILDDYGLTIKVHGKEVLVG